MQHIRFQQTIEHVAHVSGRGYWSGRPVTLTFLPASSDSGIVFRRIDLTGRPEIHANTTQRRETSLRTTLLENGAHVEMVEHVMAALHGMEIDNCVVECDAPEMPGMDGSALAFCVALDRAGVRQLTAQTRDVAITVPLRVGDETQWIMAVPSSDPGLTIQYQLDYGPNNSIPPSTSTFQLDRETFAQHIAPARTFVTDREARELQMQGVASHVTYRDLIVFGPSGPIDNSLRFDDECSRHKLLDLVGDMSLCGLRVQGKIIARRSGHVLNGRMAQAIRNFKDSQVPSRNRIAA
ncbi:MAG: UDP-3-O-acyl-N-acetylglucosamine deacetylase [Pirellula sp.]